MFARNCFKIYCAYIVFEYCMFYQNIAFLFYQSLLEYSIRVYAWCVAKLKVSFTITKCYSLFAVLPSRAGLRGRQLPKAPGFRGPQMPKIGPQLVAIKRSRYPNKTVTTLIEQSIIQSSRTLKSSQVILLQCQGKNIVDWCGMAVGSGCDLLFFFFLSSL